MDVDSEPAIIRVCRGGALGDVVQGLVHGEEERDDLPPLGEVSTGGVDLELDIISDVYSKEGVGRIWWGEDDGGRDVGSGDDRQIGSKGCEVEGAAAIEVGGRWEGSRRRGSCS